MSPLKHLTTRPRIATGARRSGVAIVEFAVVANLMILVVFTCFEFARLNMIRNLSQDAAYFAARRAMVPGATSEDAAAEARRILSVMGTRGATVTINSNQPITDETQNLEVRITVPLGENALLAPNFTKDKDFVAIARMKTERFDEFSGMP